MSNTPIRTVLFLTAMKNADIPTDGVKPACLLPFGHATFIERILESLATAGVTQVDLVLCEQPEEIRSVLKDGWRWSMEIKWHLIQDLNTPYDIISHLAKLSKDRLMIGHADRWVSTQVISQLMQKNLVAIESNTDSDWSGWLSMSAEQATTLSPYLDEDEWAQWIKKIEPKALLALRPDEYAACNNERALHEAQYLALSQSQLAPVTWIRYPWGVASPDAMINDKAIINGPVLVGPRCTIGGGAQIGPGVVLSHDILVSGGASIRDALVLQNTYISSTVNINEAIIGGNSMTSLRHKVTFTIPSKEGLIDNLKLTDSAPNSLFGQILAAILMMIFTPLLPVLLAWQIFHSRQFPWRHEQIVVGTDSNQALQYRSLRLPYPSTGFSGYLLGMIGGLIDIIQTQRSWIGIYPRNKAQWYVLRKPWQTLFSHKPIGLLNIPGWEDEDQQSDDIQAANDAYLIVQIGCGKKFKILKDIVMQFNPKKIMSSARKPK